MLAYSQLQALPAPEQEAYVRACGSFIVSRLCGSFVVHLYYVPGYYCELWRESSTAQLAYVHAFTGQTGLYPYLSQISLPQSLLA